MKYTNNNIQHAGLTDVRTNTLQARIRIALAGAGLAGALLVGGLFGAHGNIAATPAHAASVSTKTAVVASSTQAQNVALAYHSDGSYVDMARQAAEAAGISPDYFVRQIQQESGFNPNAGSPAGAEGIAQFMPGTAASMGVNPYDPSSALNGAARLMASLNAQYGGNYSKALAAYNAGGGAVDAAVAQAGSNWLAYMPTETQNYVAIIMG